MLTGRQPNISKMQKFGLACYAWKHDKGKLDSRYEKGIFIGYDKNSQAYIIYSKKIQKHFLSKMSAESEMIPYDDDFILTGHRTSSV